MFENKKVLFIAFLFLLVLGILFLLIVSGDIRIPGKRRIVLTGGRGDFVKPPPIQEECQEQLELRIKEAPDIYSGCQVVKSRVGYGDEECKYGSSPQGCYICVIECK